VSAQAEDGFNQHDKRQQADDGDADGATVLNTGPFFAAPGTVDRLARIST
jgi:hypothetical protein